MSELPDWLAFKAEDFESVTMQIGEHAPVAPGKYLNLIPVEQVVALVNSGIQSRIGEVREVWGCNDESWDERKRVQGFDPHTHRALLVCVREVKEGEGK